MLKLWIFPSIRNFIIQYENHDYSPKIKSKCNIKLSKIFPLQYACTCTMHQLMSISRLKAHFIVLYDCKDFWYSVNYKMIYRMISHYFWLTKVKNGQSCLKLTCHCFIQCLQAKLPNSFLCSKLQVVIYTHICKHLIKFMIFTQWQLAILQHKYGQSLPYSG